MLVTLIGAGPGDPDLLTLGAQRALESCDVVVYDALANAEFLKYAPENAEKIYVGKIADQHAMPQSEINRLLAEKARANGGQRVARLKGGDPFIFGRGGEEALYLKEAGVPFRVIPGVTSAIAAPACAGIPLTHRSFTSSLTILTGHEDPDKEHSAIHWQALAQSGSTLVFVMGMKNLGKIVHRLMAAGMRADMPAAVIERGTTPLQRSVFAPLASLPEKAAHLDHPAVIVVGEVASLGPELDWRSQMPLLGKTIVVTRAREQASQLCESLIALGARVLQCPAIKIEAMPDYAALDAAIGRLAAYRWLVFTSVNGVKYFWQRLTRAGLDSRALAPCEIAAIGPATAQALLKKGIRADLQPKGYVAEELAAAMIGRDGPNLKGARVLLPRAEQARSVLPDTLAAAGAVVDICPAYRAVPDASGVAEVLDLLRKGALDCVTFASSSTARNFLDLIPAHLLMGKKRPMLAAIGPITAESLRQNGLCADIEPEKYTIPCLVEAICGHFTHHA